VGSGMIRFVLMSSRVSGAEGGSFRSGNTRCRGWPDRLLERGRGLTACARTGCRQRDQHHGPPDRRRARDRNPRRDRRRPRVDPWRRGISTQLGVLDPRRRHSHGDRVFPGPGPIAAAVGLCLTHWVGPWRRRMSLRRSTIRHSGGRRVLDGGAMEALWNRQPPGVRPPRPAAGSEIGPIARRDRRPTESRRRSLGPCKQEVTGSIPVGSTPAVARTILRKAACPGPLVRGLCRSHCLAMGGSPPLPRVPARALRPCESTGLPKSS